jgi:hypothetical protein
MRIARSEFLHVVRRKQNMPLAPIDDIELYYEVHGAGPPLMLAHGGGSNHLTWWPQVVDLMDAYSVIGFDRSKQLSWRRAQEYSRAAFPPL